ncbi:MAG: hypothetical protein IPJ30_12860 [Acidobacteria bacterium]|nr:hypothetical protein [Acidobacteriota bacterium]
MRIHDRDAGVADRAIVRIHDLTFQMSAVGAIGESPRKREIANEFPTVEPLSTLPSG